MKRSSTFIGRLSGLAMIIGGLLWAVGGSTALNSEALGITMRGPHLVLSVGGLFSLIGLTRLVRHQAGDYGGAGMAGAILASAGVALVIASKNLPSSISEEAAWNVFYLGGFLLVIGSLLFGIVVLRTSKAWFFGAPLLAIGGLVILEVVFLMVLAEPAYLGTVLLPILIGLAWSVLGYALWSYEAKPALRYEPRTSAEVPA